MVRPEIVLVVPVLKENIWTALLPLIVRWFVPGPAITVLSVTVGSGEESTIVPLMVKTMVSSPGVALASDIAWRSDPGPESPVEVTVKVTAWVVATARPRSNTEMALNLIFADLMSWLLLNQLGVWHEKRFMARREIVPGKGGDFALGKGSDVETAKATNLVRNMLHPVTYAASDAETAKNSL